MQRKVTKAGFTLVRSTFFVSLLLPAMTLSRRRRTTEKRDAMAEFQIPRWLEASFGAVLAAQRWAIRCGLNFAAGGPRLVVARRPG